MGASKLTNKVVALPKNQLTIHVLKAAPAFGKTYTAIAEAVKGVRLGRKYVFAAITKKLCDEILADIEKLSGGAVLARRIYSDDGADATELPVGSRISSAVEDGVDVIIITHNALLENKRTSQFWGYKLFIDELPDIFLSGEFYANNMMTQALEPFLIPVDGVESKFVLDPEKRIEARAFLDDSAGSLHEDALDVLVSLLAGGAVYKSDPNSSNKVRHCHYRITDIKGQISSFEEVSLLCANFDGLLTEKILDTKFGIEVKGSQLQLRRTSYDNPGRVTILPLLVEGVKASRSIFNKCIDAEGRVVPDGGTPVYKVLYGEIAKFLINNEIDKYAFTQNKRYDRGLAPYVEAVARKGIPRKGLFTPKDSHTVLNPAGIMPEGEWIGYNPHGVNDYSGHTCLVAMLHYNPHPQDRTVLAALEQEWELGPGELIEAYIHSRYLEPVFQFCTRGDIRNHGSDKEITLIVPDMRAANYIRDGWLKDAKISMELATKVDSVSLIQNATGRPAGFQKQLGMDTREKQKFSREHRKFTLINGRKLDVNDMEDVELVEEWLAGWR